MPNHSQKLERLLDLVAEALIISEIVETPKIVEDNQTFIRNGILQKGAGEGVLALFQKEFKANQQDLNQTTDDGETIAQYAELIDFENYDVEVDIRPPISGHDYFQVVVSTTQTLPFYDITNLVQSSDGFDVNPLNISQFIPLTNEGLQQSVVDVEQAEEYLDTNIFELLPSGDTRQSRIIRFFQELNALLPPEPGSGGQPPFDFPDDDDDRVNRDNNFNWVSASLYDQNTSISYAQDNQDSNIDEEDAFIHRLKSTANDTNTNTTIEDIYNTILPYLTDILEDEISPQDDRPIYENQSSGYLQFRNLNQGIIIRNTNQDFIEGLDPNNLTYLDKFDSAGNLISKGTGFTITMWVRFLDKVSEGTLFNFGNPTRVDNPFGFKLETYVLDKDGVNPNQYHDTWGDGATAINQNQYFENSNTARFVRLVVYDVHNDGNPILRDSHVGNIATKLANIPDMDGSGDDEFRLLQTTFIPEDFNEWYFICASFNPNVDEDNSDFSNTNPNYWLNHMNADNSYINFSGLGNRCKVEIISKSDLLRARGFKV